MTGPGFGVVPEKVGEVGARAEFGHLGPVEREVIDRVTAPTGIIGSESLAAWTRRRQDR